MGCLRRLTALLQTPGMASWDSPGEFLLGSEGSSIDCKGLTRFLTKALKKVSSKPVVKFLCEPYGAGFHRVKVKSARKCDEYLGSTNALLDLFEQGDFQQCSMATTTTAKPAAPANLASIAIAAAAAAAAAAAPNRLVPRSHARTRATATTHGPSLLHT